MSNAPLIYIVFLTLCYIIFYISGKTTSCLGSRESDTSSLMEIHSIAMLTGFFIPILSIFRLQQSQLIVVIPYFIELTTSYVIHRIGTYFITLLSYLLKDTMCSKDGRTPNGINNYSYTIVYFFLFFIRLLNSTDRYPQSSHSSITFETKFPSHPFFGHQLLKQSFGPFSIRYSCCCQSILRQQQKCNYHTTVYMILSIYIISGTICLGHIIIHGYSTFNQIYFGVLFGYLMVFLYDVILYCFRPMIKSVTIITFFYWFVFIMDKFIAGEHFTFSFYHLICIVDFVVVYCMKTNGK
ncbi:Uncharacterized protein QTN25_008617 [Entamoeba marina]